MECSMPYHADVSEPDSSPRIISKYLAEPDPARRVSILYYTHTHTHLYDQRYNTWTVLVPALIVQRDATLTISDASNYILQVCTLYSRVHIGARAGSSPVVARGA